MKCINMSYKGFEFPVNISSINADFSKRVSTIPIPKGSARAQEVCFNPTVISGSGCFTGEDMSEKAHMLMSVFQSRGAAYLFSPVFSPLKMHLSELRLSADSENNCIKYSFKFIEEASVKRRRYGFGYTFALRGENLFDVANRCAVSFEDIAERNSFKDMFSVKEGDKIWLK